MTTAVLVVRGCRMLLMTCDWQVFLHSVILMILLTELLPVDLLTCVCGTDGWN